MENDTYACETILSTRFLLSESQRIFLIFYVILIDGVLNFVLNSLVIATLVKTKQYRSPALRIMLYMSIADVSLSIITPLVYVLLLTKYKDSQSCLVEMSGQFACQFLGHVSILLIGQLAFDRYARIKYLQEYRNKMSKKRINLMTLLVIGVSLLNACLLVLGTILEKHKLFALLVFAIDGVIISIVVFLNLKAMLTLNQHCREAQSTRLEDIRVNVVALTKAILFTVTILYTIYITVNLIHLFTYHTTVSLYWKQILEFSLHFGLMLAITNSLANAILFVRFNKDSHKLITDIFCNRRKVEMESQKQYSVPGSQTGKSSETTTV